MKVNVIFSTSVTPVFTDEQDDAMKKAFNVSWRTDPQECRVVDGRHMTQAVIEASHVAVVDMALEDSGKFPMIIGVWDIDTGEKIETDYLFDKAEYEKYVVSESGHVNSFAGQATRDIS